MPVSLRQSLPCPRQAQLPAGKRRNLRPWMEGQKKDDCNKPNYTSLLVLNPKWCLCLDSLPKRHISFISHLFCAPSTAREKAEIKQLLYSSVPITYLFSWLILHRMQVPSVVTGAKIHSVTPPLENTWPHWALAEVGIIPLPWKYLFSPFGKPHRVSSRMSGLVWSKVVVERCSRPKPPHVEGPPAQHVAVMA